jgi:hypothetical protein
VTVDSTFQYSVTADLGHCSWICASGLSVKGKISSQSKHLPRVRTLGVFISRKILALTTVVLSFIFIN